MIKSKRVVSLILCFALMISGITVYDAGVNAAVSNVANGKNSTCYTTSNANTGSEGFCYVGNGFSAINMCNESYSNGNNLLGKTATTDEVAIYLDLQADYSISSVKLYQGSTNSSYPDSFCTSYSVYYSTDTVDTSNEGDIDWVLAGSTDEGKIYNGSSIKITETTEDYQTSTGDEIVFDEEYVARSVKIVFDADYCMGTGSTEGTVSVVSLQVYGESTEEETTTEDSSSDDSDDDTTDILFIGNSMTYYNTLSEVVEGLANHYDRNVTCTAATNGGRNLVYQSTASNVLSAIQAGGYEVVVLQDIVGSFDGDDLLTGVSALKETILEYNPDAQIVLYEPWPVEGSLTGDSSLLPYFTYSYIKAAKTYDTALGAAGEAFYAMYVYEDESYYCSDEKHPLPLGTFVSAVSVYYAIYQDSEQMVYTSSEQDFLDDLINSNIAYSGASSTSYDIDTLNKISEYAYQYTGAVNEAINNNTSYESVAGSYYDADDEINSEGLTAQTGTEISSDLFSAANGNIAVGCDAEASSTIQSASNATDGNTGTRWESEYEDPSWFVVDLGEIKCVEKVGFIWEGAYAKKYYIQLSVDGETWKTVAAVTASSADTVQITLDSVYNAQYVRMYGTKRGTGYGYSFYEIGVWEGDSDLAVDLFEDTTTEEDTTTTTEAETTTTTTAETTTTVEETTTTIAAETTTTEAETTTATAAETTTTTVAETETDAETQAQTETSSAVTDTSSDEATTVADTDEDTVSSDDGIALPVETASDETEAASNSGSASSSDNSGTESVDSLVPSKAKIKKAKIKKSNKKISIKLKKISGASFYKVQISKKKKFNRKNIVIKKKVTKTKLAVKLSKIKSKYKKLYVRARAVALVSGKKYKGAWSKAKKIK